MNRSTSGLPITLLLAGAFSIFAAVLIRTAWLCDDAYITLRTVDNLVSGLGPVWNVGERVQAFTHPLWMLLLSAVYLFTREAYVTTVVISIAVSLATAVVLVFGAARSRWTGLFVLVALMLGQAAIDFSTSGLENPLTHFLLLAFIAVYLRTEQSARQLAILALLAALGTLNRPDTFLLFLPALGAVWWRLPRRRATFAVLIGFVPLIAWEAFAVFYYGFPASNTAYAKLNTGIDQGLLISQGLYYLYNAIAWQPFTPFIIVAGVIGGVAGRKHGMLPPAMGILLYLFYVVNVGGDFMTGRFLSAPFVLALALLAQTDISPARMNRTAAALLVLAVGVFSPGCPLFSGSRYGVGDEGGLWSRGIGDERAAYYQTTGWLAQHGGSPTPDHPWAREGLALRLTPDTVLLRAGVGLLGFFAGPSVTIVDRHALCDAFLARIPTWSPNHWRIGHFNRIPPDGYLDSRRAGGNLIADDSLRMYFDHLRTVISGPLFSSQRLKEIVRFNLGRYNHLIESYWSQPTLVVAPGDLAEIRPDGTPWNAPGCFLLPPGGMRVSYAQPHHERYLEISTDANDAYELRFRRDTVLLGRAEIPARYADVGGLQKNRIMIDSTVAEIGFDRIDVVGAPGGVWSVGHLVLLSPENDVLIGESFGRMAGEGETVISESDPSVDVHRYAGTIALRRMRVTETPDSLVFYFAFEALQPIATRYRVFFHIVEIANDDRFHNFDFRPERPVLSWLPGEPIVERRAIGRLERPLRCRIGLFTSDGRLGKPYQVDLNRQSRQGGP